MIFRPLQMTRLTPEVHMNTDHAFNASVEQVRFLHHEMVEELELDPLTV
jgi:hypothetical protein